MSNFTNNYNLYKWDKTDNKLSTIEESANNADKIDTALTNINTAALEAKTEADGAVTTANNAKNTAESIADTANSAVTTANNAVTTANSAVTTANEASATATDAKTTATTVQSQFNQVVAEAGSNNPEVVQARGTYPLLNDRITNAETQLADIAIDAMQYGVKGDNVTDDSTTLKNAILAAKNRKLVVPFGNYRLASLVNIPLTNGDSIHIDFRGSTLTLDTNDSAWEVIQLVNYTANNGCKIFIENVNVVGINMVSETHWGAATKSYKKNVPFALAADNIKFKNVTFKDVWGFGAKFSYFNKVEVENVTCDNVGGHSFIYTADSFGNDDSFGDALYFDHSCGDAEVLLKNIRATGMVNALNPALDQTNGPVSNLSRAFCVFENIGSAGTLTIDAVNCKAENYQRMWHFENTPTSNLNIVNFTGDNGGLFAEHYQASGSNTLSVKGTNIEYSQNANERFLTAYGMGGYYIGEFYGGSFSRLGKPFDGNVNNEDLGYNITFNKSVLYFEDSRLHGAGGSFVLNDCDIYDYNDDAGHPYVTVKYNSCRFSTTMPSTYGNILSASSGTETFYDCTFTNQLPDISKTIQQCKYRDDNGLYQTGCIRVNSNTTEFTKIKNSLVRVTEIDTGIARIGYITNTGSVYAPGSVPAIQEGSTGKFKVGGTVTLSCIIEVIQH
jgi:hypothetical protein